MKSLRWIKNMAIHQQVTTSPRCNPFIHSIFWHRFPFSFEHPNSSGVTSSTQQSLSPSITHRPTTAKHRHANKRIHSPTPESWATAAVSVGLCSTSLHMESPCRLQEHGIAEDVPCNGVVPAVLPQRPWGWPGGSHHPDKAAGLGRQAKPPAPYDQRSWGPSAVFM